MVAEIYEPPKLMTENEILSKRVPDIIDVFTTKVAPQSTMIITTAASFSLPEPFVEEGEIKNNNLTN